MNVNEIFEAMDAGKPIQLPCKTGDTIYVLHDGSWGNKWINQYECAGFHFTDKLAGWRKGERSAYLIARGATGAQKHIHIDLIGTAVFFSEEEARRHLYRHGGHHGA